MAKEKEDAKNLQLRTTPEFNRQLNELVQATNLRKSPVVFLAVKELYDRRIGKTEQKPA